MSEKKLAYDFWNTPEGIRSQKIFDMRDRIRRLEASNAVLLVSLEACCIATQGKKKAFCECFQHDSRPCLDMEGVCWFGERGNCSIWNAIQKAKE